MGDETSTPEQTEGSGPSGPIGGDMPIVPPPAAEETIKIDGPPVPSDPPPGNDGRPTAPPPRSMQARRLGKASPRIDERIFQLARYLPTSLPPAPPACDWSKGASVDWGMMENDTLGDCTCAAGGHAIQGWSASNGREITLTDADILKAYEEACGYVRGDPSTDNGGVEIDVLNYWRKVGIGGHKIKAFAALEPKNRQHVEQSVFLFGGVYIGVALPETAQEQEDWTVDDSGENGDPTAGSWGGHAVWVYGYDAHWVYFITWGRKKRMSWAFWNAYCDESYALLSQDWADSDGAPSKFDLDQLNADLAQVGHPSRSRVPEIAAAAQASRAAHEAAARAHGIQLVAPGDIKVAITKRIFESGGGEVVATNKAGMSMAILLVPVHPPADPKSSLLAVNLTVDGKGYQVQFEIGELEGFGQALQDVFMSMRMRSPEIRDEGDDV